MRDKRTPKDVCGEATPTLVSLRGFIFTFLQAPPSLLYAPRAESLLPLGAPLEQLKKIRSHYSIFLFGVALALRKANFLAEILALNKSALCRVASLAFRLKFRLLLSPPPNPLKKYHSQSRCHSTSTSTSTLLYKISASPQRRTDEWCRISQL